MLPENEEKFKSLKNYKNAKIHMKDKKYKYQYEPNDFDMISMEY